MNEKEDDDVRKSYSPKPGGSGRSVTTAAVVASKLATPSNRERLYSLRLERASKCRTSPGNLSDWEGWRRLVRRLSLGAMGVEMAEPAMA